MRSETCVCSLLHVIPFLPFFHNLQRSSSNAFLFTCFHFLSSTRFSDGFRIGTFSSFFFTFVVRWIQDLLFELLSPFSSSLHLLVLPFHSQRSALRVSTTSNNLHPISSSSSHTHCPFIMLSSTTCSLLSFLSPVHRRHSSLTIHSCCPSVFPMLINPPLRLSLSLFFPALARAQYSVLSACYPLQASHTVDANGNAIHVYLLVSVRRRGDVLILPESSLSFALASADLPDLVSVQFRLSDLEERYFESRA